MSERDDFDALLEKAAALASYHDFCKIEEKMLEQGPHEFSPQFEEKMNLLLYPSRIGQSMNSKTEKPKRGRVKIRYLLIAVLLMILCSTTVFAYEPARELLKNIVYTIFDDHISIGPGDASTSLEEQEGEAVLEQNANMQTGESVFQRPGYIPEGYDLCDEFVNEETRELRLFWVDDQGNTLTYIQIEAESGKLILSSSGDEPQDIKIGNIDGKFILEDDDMKTIFYEMDNSIYILVGTLEQKELVTILLSLK